MNCPECGGVVTKSVSERIEDHPSEPIDQPWVVTYHPCKHTHPGKTLGDLGFPVNRGR